MRWQRGLSESLSMNFSLLFHPRSGAVGWLAFPFMMIFEWLGPLVEVTGYLFMILIYLFGVISVQALLVFLFIAVGFGLLLSASGLLVEELTFHLYPRDRHLLLFVGAVLLENLGYRQINSLWRLIGLFRWLFRSSAHWGEMKRKGTWQGK